MEQTNKIFIIEDEKFLREMLEDKFKAEKFNTDSVTTGKEALVYLEKEKPALIILDLLLPDVNGFEILAKIRGEEKTKDIPVIVLTNYDQKEDIERCKKLGIFGFMVKTSFSLNEIIAEARKALSA
ncbi:MAG TPA: response regulator [Candidatus Paceibacterota bacterium]|nr:response regulator [Candidatus Paceibacterota bacterium]